MNSVVVWNGITIADVGWHNMRWKLIPNGTEFDTVTDRAYEPVAQFRTRDELWQHIKDNIINTL